MFGIGWEPQNPRLSASIGAGVGAVLSSAAVAGLVSRAASAGDVFVGAAPVAAIAAVTLGAAAGGLFGAVGIHKRAGRDGADNLGMLFMGAVYSVDAALLAGSLASLHWFANSVAA